MFRIDFHEPLTALEIREPTLEICRQIAASYGLFAVLTQYKQQAFKGYMEKHVSRERIGNGKHSVWDVNFQPDHPSTNKPNVIGKLLVRGPYLPAEMQYGGFDYGVFGQEAPTYSHMTIRTPTDVDAWRPVDPAPDLLEEVQQGLEEYFVRPYPALFDGSRYSVDQVGV